MFNVHKLFAENLKKNGKVKCTSAVMESIKQAYTKFNIIQLNAVREMPHYEQIWACLPSYINMIGWGISLGYTLSLMQGLKDPGCIIRPSAAEASWIASIIGGAVLPGAFVAVGLMQARGRRAAVAINAAFGGLGWLLLFFAGDVPTLILGRVLTGINGGSSLTLGTSVMGEYTSPKHRGLFLAIKASLVPIGSMFAHFMANFLDWRTTALIFAAPYTLGIFITLTCPDTPAWLVTKKRFDQARQAFVWLRGDDNDSEKEFNAFLSAQTALQASMMTAKRSKIADFIAKFKRRDFIIPLGVSVITAILMEVSGRKALSSYAAEFVRRIGAGRLHVFTFTMIMDIVTVVSSLVSSICMRFFSRRGLLFGSGFTGLGVLMVACLYLLLVSRGVISVEYPLVPMVLVLVFVFISNLSCCNICIVLIGEIFPLIHKGHALCVFSVVYSLKVQVMLHVSPMLLEYMDVHGTFFLFGLLSLVCLIALWWLLPETHNKTLQEIEDGFMAGQGGGQHRDVLAGTLPLL